MHRGTVYSEHTEKLGHSMAILGIPPEASSSELGYT